MPDLIEKNLFDFLSFDHLEGICQGSEVVLDLVERDAGFRSGN
jgi:hypothetical protein